MAYAKEPEIIKGQNPEGTFQIAIKKEITKMLDQKIIDDILKEYIILEKFGLDIAVFLKWADNRSSIRFFELKAFVGSRQGGVGFGNRRGEGSQVELLLLGDRKLGLADQFIRWILADGTKSKGIERFVIFNNKQAKNSAMGSVKKGKQNNFRVNVLMRKAITWNKLLEEIEHFLIQ